MSFGDFCRSPKCTVRKGKLELQFQKAGGPETDLFVGAEGRLNDKFGVRSKQLATGCRHLCEEGSARNLGQVPGRAQ